MKTSSFFLALLLAATGVVFTGCSSGSRNSPVADAPSTVGSPADSPEPVEEVDEFDDLDEYDGILIADPLEALNRATFMMNHGIYTVIVRPVSRGYEFMVPELLRNGIHNAFENVRFPVRLVNNLLQANFTRAGQETGKFVVNTVVGVGGLMRPSEGIPALANLPEADTGQTFAKWGIGRGPYLVLPILGPSTVRDTFGLAGDYALNPINWVTIVYGGYTWTLAIPSANTLRSMPPQIDQYDDATRDALDQYLAARSAYIQFRDSVALR